MHNGTSIREIPSGDSYPPMKFVLAWLFGAWIK